MYSIAFMSGAVGDRAAKDSVCMGSACLVPVMLHRVKVHLLSYCYWRVKVS